MEDELLGYLQEKDPNDIKNQKPSLGNYLRQFETASDYNAQMKQSASGAFADLEESSFQSNRRRNKEHLSGLESAKGYLDLNEVQAQAQSGWEKAGRGVGRVLAETTSNILQIPGYVGGAFAAGMNEMFGSGEGSMDMFVNNWWTDSLESATEYFNSEMAPVYVKNSVQNGNLAKNIFSTDFWATEGASGLAFLLSAFAPGAAVKAFGTGAKLANAIGKSKKLYDGTKILEKADKISKMVGLGNLENATNVVGATFANTMYEAGKEAEGAMSSYKNQLNEKLKAGEITNSQYSKLIGEAPEQAAKVFRDNIGILLVPNMIMSKALFGKAIPSNQLDKFQMAEGKIQSTLEKVGKKQATKNVLSTIGKATASEGFIEEAGQMTSEKYHTEGYIDKMLGHGGKSYAETYFDVIGSTEGQKAMFLGGLFGSGAMLLGNHNQKKADKKAQADLVGVMTNGVNFFESSVEGIYKKEDGEIVYKNGIPQVDNDKVAQLGEQTDYINSIESQRNFYKVAAEEGLPGAAETAALLDRSIINNMLMSFTHAGEEGTAVLKNYLQNSDGLKNLVKSINATSEVKKSETQVINDIINEAEALRKDVEHYTKYGEFTNELYKNKEDSDTYNKYSTILKNKYANSKSNLRLLEEKRKELDGARNVALLDFIRGSGIKGMDHTDYTGELPDSVKAIDNRIDIINELERDIEVELKAVASVNQQKKAYKEFKTKETNRLKAEEEAKELDIVLNNIKAAKTDEELANVDIPNKFKKGAAASAIARSKSDKKEEFLNHNKKKEKETKDSSKNTKEEQEKKAAEKAAKVDYVKNNYNVGETVPTDDIELPEDFEGEAILDSITEDGVVVKDNNGKEFTIDINNFYTANYNPEDTLYVEGSERLQKVNERNTVSTNTSDKLDARVVVTDNKKSGKVSLLADNKMFKDAYEFETEPVNKKGYYGISINPAFVNKKTTKQSSEVKLNRPYKTFNDGSNTMVTVETETTEKDGIKKTKFKTQTTNKKGEPRTQNDKGYNTFEEAVENLDIDLRSEENESVFELVETLKEAQAKESLPARVVEIRESTDKSSPIFGLRTATVIVSGEKIDFRLKSQPVQSKNNLAKGDIKKALDAYNSGDYSNLELLVEHLPLAINLTDIVRAPLENKTKGDTKIFDDTTRVLKTVIVKELAKDTPIESIEIEIKGQYGGKIQLATDNNGLPMENNVKDLHEFRGDLSKITSDDFYIVNDLGKLENGKNDTSLSTKRPLAKGEIYLKIKTANGTPFPLKLNTLKVSRTEADLLYDLFKLRFQDFEEGKIKEEANTANRRINDLNPDILTKLQEEFPEVIELFKKEGNEIEDLTVSDIIRFFIWDGSKSIKSRVRFSRGDLLVGDAVFTEEEFLANREGFIDKLTSVKRRLVKFKKAKNDTNNLNLQNRHYLEYLINNKVVNTNAVVNEPTFQERTTMYLGTKTVRVNGVLSEENASRISAKKSQVINGSNSSLKKVLPGIFENKLELTADEANYKDSLGRLYKRMTDLKESTIDSNDIATINGSKRGNVIDNLLRDFFAPNNNINTVEEFIVLGNKYVQEENEKNAKTDLIMGDSFFSGLLDVFLDYSDYFYEQELTVYSNVPTMSMKFGEDYYAGTIDLLLYDNKRKSWYIVDLKTSSIDRQESYEETNAYNYKSKDAIQQNGYREAFSQTAKGTISKLFIMPIQTKSDSAMDSSTYLESTPSKMKDKFFLAVDMSKDIYELKSKKKTTKVNVSDFESGDNTDSGMDDSTVKAFQAAGGEKLDLAAFGILPEEAPVKKKPVPPKKKKSGDIAVNVSVVKSQVEKQQLTEVTIKGRSYYVIFPIITEVNGKKTVSEGLYVLNKKTYKHTTSLDIFKEAIEEYNDAATYLGVTRVGEKTAQRIWNSRNNVVSLQENEPIVKSEEVVNKIEEKFSAFNLSDTEAASFYKSMLKNKYIKGVDRKALNPLLVGKSAQQKVDITVKYLIDKGVNKEQLIKDCK